MPDVLRQLQEQAPGLLQKLGEQAVSLSSTSIPVPEMLRQLGQQAGDLSSMSKPAFEQTKNVAITATTRTLESIAEASNEYSKHFSACEEMCASVRTVPPGDMQPTVLLQDEWMRLEEDGSVSMTSNDGQDRAQEPDNVHVAPLTSAEVWKWIQDDLCQVHPPMHAVAKLRMFIGMRDEEARQAAKAPEPEEEHAANQVGVAVDVEAAATESPGAIGASDSKSALWELTNLDIALTPSPSLDQEDLIILSEMQSVIDNLDREARIHKSTLQGRELSMFGGASQDWVEENERERKREPPLGESGVTL